MTRVTRLEGITPDRAIYFVFRVVADPAVEVTVRWPRGTIPRGQVPRDRLAAALAAALAGSESGKWARRRVRSGINWRFRVGDGHVLVTIPPDLVISGTRHGAERRELLRRALATLEEPATKDAPPLASNGRQDGGEVTSLPAPLEVFSDASGPTPGEVPASLGAFSSWFQEVPHDS